MNEVHILDFEKLTPEILEKIETGVYKVFNGVVRKNGVIVKEIPTKVLELTKEELENLPSCIGKGQGAAIAATAASTAIILGAIIVATKIIVNKLNEIQRGIDAIQKELQDQNQFQYFLQLKNYVAASESMRELLSSPECIEENKDLIAMKLNEISIQRHGLMLTFRERLYNVEKVSPEHKKEIVTFLENSIVLLPKIAYLESEGAKAIGRYSLSRTINEQFSPAYRRIENNYILFLENELNKSTRGESILSKNVIDNIRKNAKIEFEINNALLTSKKKSLSISVKETANSQMAVSEGEVKELSVI